MSTTSDTLLAVKQLKASAKANRDFEDYDEAIKDLQKAIDLLLPIYKEVQNSPSEVSEYLTMLRRELADCYGMIGGIYRRQEDLDSSAQSYSTGLKFEVDDSYNLANSIVMSILADSKNLTKLQKEIRDGIALVQTQVKGTRKDQWWAWADLGLLNLLNGDSDAALNAYGQFRRTGARSEDYDSTLLVLRQLEGVLTHAKSPVSENIGKAIHFLTDSRPN